MKTILISLAAAAALCLLGLKAHAQTPDTTDRQPVRIIMQDGVVYEGEMQEPDPSGEIITLKTTQGIFNLLSSQVKTIEPIEDADPSGKFNFINPHPTRYFVGPTAVPIERFQGYYQNLLFTSNFANVGLTHHISVGGGVELISLMGGNPYWFFTPKVGIQADKNIYLGGGLMVAGLGRQGTASLAYSVATVGSIERNISVGVGYGRWNGSWAKSPVLMASGTYRITDELAFLSENYLLGNGENGYTPISMVGMRIFTKRVAFDAGAIGFPTAEWVAPALPFFGFAMAL
ncbi:MAG: hypothetical protein SF053_14335 [Bacteroidia bacterium]|nr:hypothetical protein [Bacteroidia bacterium]